MKHILLLALSLALLIAGCAAFLAAFAEGGETRFYSPSGDYIGRAEPQQTGEVRFYDGSGNYTGRAEPAPTGGARYYDRQGNHTGRSEPGTLLWPKAGGLKSKR